MRTETLDLGDVHVRVNPTRTWRHDDPVFEVTIRKGDRHVQFDVFQDLPLATFEATFRDIYRQCICGDS